MRKHCPSSHSSRSCTCKITILLMKASSFWQSGCWHRFSFVIRHPLTDGQEFSIWFACLSLRQRLWHTAPFTNHDDSSNKRTLSRELRFQVQEMLQEHLGWKAEDFLYIVKNSSCAGAIISTLLMKFAPCGSSSWSVSLFLE